MITASPHMAALMLLSIAAAGWYIASRTAADALAGAAAAPGRRAVGHAIPVLAVAMMGVLIGRADLAIGVIFATSVAALTLVLGIVIVSANHTLATSSRRLWGFVLPVALISLLIGFSSAIGWVQALMLLLEGVFLLLLWNDPRSPVAVATQEPAPVEPLVADPSARSMALRLTQLFFALSAAAIASWAGLVWARQVSGQLGIPGFGLVAALMLAPALVLSMIGSGSHAASEGHFDHAAAQLVGFVLINLCAILPLMAMLWITRPMWHGAIQQAYASAVDRQNAPAAPLIRPHAPATTSTSRPASDDAAAQDAEPGALPYPISVWRVDTVLLIAIGLLLLPVALNRWTLARSEGIGLIAAYVMYMVLTTLMAR
jgi:Ca2+/Na+ antiporter